MLSRIKQGSNKNNKHNSDWSQPTIPLSVATSVQDIITAMNMYIWQTVLNEISHVAELIHPTTTRMVMYVVTSNSIEALMYNL